jgi:hypothetical protein
MTKTFTPIKKRSIRILYVGGFGKNSVGEPEIANALECLGHSVTRKESSFTTPAEIESLTSDFDLLLFSKVKTPVNLEAQRMIARLTIPTVSWVFDLYWGYERQQMFNTEPHFVADVVFTTDGGHEEQFERRGIRHHCLRQGIAEGIKPAPRWNGKPIIFVGSDRSNLQRTELLKWLRRTYPDDFAVYGERDGVRHEKLDKVIGGAKIVMGDSVISPHYWSNRIYETIGRAGFMLHPKTEGLDDEFRYYKHFVPYTAGDWKGLKEKIDHYLTHDKERDAIRMAGYEHCHKEHTYTHRVKKMLEILRHE